MKLKAIMAKTLLATLIFIIGLNFLTASAFAMDTVHTPPQGSAERQAILDVMRNAEAVRFQVHFLKVHNGWAWIDVTPLGKDGKAVAEGGTNLLHLENGKWVLMDLSKVAEDPNDPLGAQDSSKVFVSNLRKVFRGVPADIFPKPSH